MDEWGEEEEEDGEEGRIEWHDECVWSENVWMNDRRIDASALTVPEECLFCADVLVSVAC